YKPPPTRPTPPRLPYTPLFRSSRDQQYSRPDDRNRAGMAAQPAGAEQSQPELHAVSDICPALAVVHRPAGHPPTTPAYEHAGAEPGGGGGCSRSGHHLTSSAAHFR